MHLSSNVFDDSIQYLEHHQESLRIKKLIFCLCQKTWENDPNVLNRFPLNDLIVELVQTIPEKDQLRTSLYKLVKSLNRPKVYAAVANIILEKIDYIYSNLSNKDTQIVQAAPDYKNTHITGQDFLLEQVIANLNNHQQIARIKKLLFAVVQNRWENDLSQIDAYGLKNLLLELFQLYPTQEDLEIACKQLISKINKKKLYLAIFQIIFTEIQDFYEKLPEEAVDSPVPTTALHHNTQIIPLPNLSSTPQQSLNRQSPSQTTFETSVIEISPEQIRTEIQQIQKVTPPPLPKTYDIFELRRQIVQYAIPLQAKILLFSLVFHPWNRSGQDWSMLRSYIIDDLLEQVLQSGRSVAEIESQLHKAARSFSDADIYLQAASAILETIKPFL